MQWQIKRLDHTDGAIMRQLNEVFAAAFEDPDTYESARPDDAYLNDVLSQEGVIVLVASAKETVLGGLVAYVLPKLESARNEIYIYDLAVVSGARRQGIATALIREVQMIATEIGARVVYIQADLDDPGPAALYAKLGTREEVLHFDLVPLPRRSS